MTIKKLALLGYTHDTNLGDQVIADSAEYLIKRHDSNIKVERFDLNYSNEFNTFKKLKRKSINKLLSKISPNLSFKYKVGCYKRDYRNKLDDNSAVMFAGGGMIKFKYQDCWAHISALIDTAEKSECPVFFNAVGVEGVDENDFKCQLMKQSLNRDVVKMITTRDDLSLLQSGYIENKDIETAQVADSAVFCSEVYGIRRKKVREVVGVGLVRPSIFKDNGISLCKDEVVNIYAAILKELEQRGATYQLFTNGLKGDAIILSDLEKVMGKRLNLVEPKTPKELVALISSFQATIAARLHACIISYSLKVPFVGLVWNNKLKMFGDCIGYSERMFESHQFEAKLIVERLLSAASEGYEPVRYDAYRQTIDSSINKMVSMV
ncbi:polysaccharide pyruvyl transferase family protein [Vibrio maerlii]|uniref:polysaccharide pyruvyl transferase family protein n=1 Tax=Vibrio maerlii TaxID=2231648 RepID=UPI000E3EA4C3|nr:polysaccharide pyruvyl transferase family protein [Vibrio maerlii]